MIIFFSLGSVSNGRKPLPTIVRPSNHQRKRLLIIARLSDHQGRENYCAVKWRTREHFNLFWHVDCVALLSKQTCYPAIFTLQNLVAMQWNKQTILFKTKLNLLCTYSFIPNLSSYSSSLKALNRHCWRLSTTLRRSQKAPEKRASFKIRNRQRPQCGS